MPTRREFMASILATAALAAPTTAAAGVERDLSLEMARRFALYGDKKQFKQLFSYQSVMRSLYPWPSTEEIVYDAVYALTRVLAGEELDRNGFRTVKRMPMQGGKFVVFSDHHIMPPNHRQQRIWRANRGPYVKLLEHYGEQGYVVVENGDVEDLVILEPDATVRMYEDVIGRRAPGRKPRKGILADWFRDNPSEMASALRAARAVERQKQLQAIVTDPENKAYYDTLRRLSESNQHVRVAGNHDYNLQSLDLSHDYLNPYDLLMITGEENTEFVVAHGHQFDKATNPGVCDFYGEVVSECLGVFFEGPDRLWSREHSARIVEGGFPNRPATHTTMSKQGVVGSFMSALLASPAQDDDEWAQGWEHLFGYPIAWEYGANDWAGTIRGKYTQPARLVADAMAGRQFFKFRHLDELELVEGLLAADVEACLVLGHTHEVRQFLSYREEGKYLNSGAAGRFEGLIFALEILGPNEVNVVGWFDEGDGNPRRIAFEKTETNLFSFFETRKTDEVIR